MSTLKRPAPSPAMIVALIALFVALAGTAYAAQTINGGAIKKQTIGGGKLKQKTLTGFQINTNKLGIVPWPREPRQPHLLGRRQQPGQPRQRRRSPGPATPASVPARVAARSPSPSRSTSAAAPTSPAQQRRHLGHRTRATPRPTPRPRTPTRSRCGLRRKRRQRGRRLPPDRRLPVTSPARALSDAATIGLMTDAPRAPEEGVDRPEDARELAIQRLKLKQDFKGIAGGGALAGPGLEGLRAEQPDHRGGRSARDARRPLEAGWQLRPGERHVDALATKRHPLGDQPPALTGALGKRAVGADHAPPGQVRLAGARRGRCRRSAAPRGRRGP